MSKPPALSRGIRWALGGLVLLILIAYFTALRCDFLIFDDNNHVYENPVVTGGLSGAAIHDAFFTFPAGLWAPLTWLSLALDVTLFKMNPGMLHGMNVLLHLLATLLLFRAARRLIGNDYGALLVAMLFGLHPLNVESVAWVTERKNVLSAVFWMLGLNSYVVYAREKSARAWWATLVWFICGLLSKPSVTPFPCVLLLLDYWPLRRLEMKALPRLIAEKLPFFACAAIASLLTIKAQASANAIARLAWIPLPTRLAYAVENLVWYTGKLFWPSNLAAFYPHPLKVETVTAILSIAAFLLITAACLWQARRRPWWIVGWLWFVGMLIPTIGLVQVGSVARADRFPYLPQIGIWLALAMTAVPLIHGNNARLWKGCLVLTACALTALTWLQMEFWRDSRVLFERAIAVTPNNPFAWRNAANAIAAQGEYPLAIAYFKKGLSYRSGDPFGWTHLGNSQMKVGQFEDAVSAFNNAAGIDPKFAAPLYDAGLASRRLGKDDIAAKYQWAALQRQPAFFRAYRELAWLAAKKGDRALAIKTLQEGLKACNNDPRLRAELERLSDPTQPAMTPEAEHLDTGVSSDTEVPKLR